MLRIHLQNIYRISAGDSFWWEVKVLIFFPIYFLYFRFTCFLIRYKWLLSGKGSLACHTYCDTGQPLIMAIFEDPWLSYLFMRVGSWSVTTCFNDLEKMIKREEPPTSFVKLSYVQNMQWIVDIKRNTVDFLLWHFNNMIISITKIKTMYMLLRFKC